VKVRAGLMDVKHLETVDADGLEQWKPVLKASDPLAAEDARAVLAALEVEAPAEMRDEYTFDQFLAEVVGPSPDLRAVQVHKSRTHYLVDGCMTELSELRTDEGARRTIVFESPDPGIVIGTVRSLGLGARRNVNVARGLKTLVGFGARRFAVLDVGTNSVKFHVGERAADGSWTTVVDRADVTRLGQGAAGDGTLAGEPIERTVAAIVAMAEEARGLGVEAIAAVGTAGLRSAPNRDELLGAVRDRAGVEIEVIAGEEEARLAYRAATAELGSPDGPLAVFDTGGGSSQFTFGEDGRIDEQWSVNVGAARFTEQFGLDGAVSEETVRAAQSAIAAELDRLDGRAHPAGLVGMGGANTNLAAVKHGLATYDSEVVQGTVLDLAEIDRQIEMYRTADADARRSIVGLQPNRAEVILGGACIVRTVVATLGCDALTVSDRGLRHGLLVERFGV
jgi:exopolyphosphatase / guanosine-5'-triphosphate,3'-diphosphate pyrophosphatase